MTVPPVPAAADRRVDKLKPVVFGAVAVAVGLAAVFGETPGPEATHHGMVSLLPPLVALVLIFTTREVFTSLVIAITAGGAISGRWNIIDAYVIPSIGTESFALILVVYLWLLGGLVGLWSRTGGAAHFAAWAGVHVSRGPRSAKLLAWGMGMLFHQGGSISTILTGTTVRPILDAKRVSHEETSYIVDATGSPVASLVPLNAWPFYVAGLVTATTPLFATNQAAVSFYFQALPFNFYAMVSVLVTLLFAADWLPWEGGRMRAARQRSRASGELDAPGARPLTSKELTTTRVPAGYHPGLVDFVVPLGVLVAVGAAGVVPALVAGDTSRIDVPIAEAFGLAVVVAAGIGLLKGLAVQDVVDGFLDGVKGVMVAALLVALSVTLGEVTRDLGTAAYLVETTAPLIQPAVLPLLLFAIGMAVAFATGMSWGTYPVTFPLAMPLAYALNPDPTYVSICFGAVLGGGVFGDQTSPLSDTTILSSVSTGADLMDHTLTQLPLAVLAAVIAGALFLVAPLVFF